MTKRYIIMFDGLKEKESNDFDNQDEDTDKMSELLQGIASITKTVQQTLNSYEVRKLGDKVQGYVMNFTETEQKVREATNEDPWGPTGPQMQEIASFTFQYDLFSEVMGMLWKRMFQENKLAWRRVYKSLVLLNYLLKNGSERVITTSRDHMFELRALESYKCVDERGKDEGMNVRHRVKLILEILNDDDILRSERRKAKTEGREKYQGFSKEDMLGRGSSTKFDSFERWNEKKKTANSADFDSMDGNGERCFSSRREVTAFDFDTEVSHANEPELGIRERTPEPTVEEDEFGDFTSARVSSVANPPTSTVSSKVTSIQPPPTTTIKPLNSPIALKQRTVSPQRAQSSLGSAGVEHDLLGLGEFNAAPIAFAPAQSAPCMMQSTHSPHSDQSAKGQSKNTLEDIFSIPSPLPTTIAIQTTGTNGKHGFNLLPSNDNVIATTPVDLLADDLDFGNVTEHGSKQANENSQHQQQLDAYLQQHKTVSEPNSSRTAPTLGSTWEDLKGKVNIDFDNLSLKPSPSKPTPSLNELKMKSTKDSNPASLSSGNFLF